MINANERQSPRHHSIRTTELRMGNWVQKSGSQKPFRWTLEKFYEYYVSPDKAYYYEPIRLTPEILEKAGFKYNPIFTYSDRSTAERWVSGFYLIGKYYDGNGFGIEWVIAGSHSNCSAQILYVHQFQNLYFSLTGQELEINL